MTSPYASLPPRNFWRSGVAGASVPTFPDIIHPRFDIARDMRIATAGSCFAQHVGRFLRSSGYNVIDAEPPPPGLTDEEAKRFGFNLYSARHGNIYTVRQLLQLTFEAFGRFAPGDSIWHRNGRYFDALRPTVEPEGLRSIEAVQRQRARHLRAFGRVLLDADLLVFTMGLVEAWVHQPSGTVYPTAPGVVADSDKPADIALHSFDFLEIRTDLLRFCAFMRRYNPKLRVLLTVSPVPLTATATDDHVLVATTYAKATLRAVAGRVRQELDYVDYFPSFEIIAGHPSRGRFYAPNLREVTPEGVACVMQHFGAAYGNGAAAEPAATPQPEEEEADEKVICDEVLLDAFAPRAASMA